jgi:hypothetical protein
MKRIQVQSQTDENLRVSRGRGGFALSAMLCAVVILFVISAGVLSLDLHNHGFAIRNCYDIPARCSVDAALTKAFFEMNEKLKVIPWNDSSQPEITDEMRSIAPEKYAAKVSQRIKMSHRKYTRQCGFWTINCL